MTKQFSKVAVLILAVALLIGTLSGCGETPQETSKEPPSVPATTGNSESTVKKYGTTSDPSDVAKKVVENGKTYYEVRIPDSSYPALTYIQYIADDLGYFEEEGIKAVFTGIISSTQEAIAVVNKDNDVGGKHVNGLLQVLEAGGSLRAVVASPQTSADSPHMEYLVLDDGPIKEPQDTAGKRVGVTGISGCNEYISLALVEKYTRVADARGTFEFINIPIGNEETVLRNGEADIVGLHGHVPSIFANGNVRVLYTDWDVWEDVGGACPYYMRNTFIDNNPEAVKGYVAAIARAANFMNEHPDEAKKLQAQHTGVPLDTVSILYQSPDGIIKPKTITHWIDMLSAHGELSKVGTEIKVEDTYTNDFNPNSPDYKF
jgi:ABC-type nitrate/sulfonate/bicarbonate transport system substrate-binding protein